MSTVIRCSDYESDDDDVFSKLPVDLVREILLKVPAEALMQLMLVSKRFKRLINDPQFAQAHFHRSQIRRPTHLLTVPRFGSQRGGHLNLFYCNLTAHPDYSSKPIQAPFKLPNSNRDYSIVGSARGVICLACIDNHVDNLFLWNPTVNRFLTVVPIPLLSSDFRRRRSIIDYGLGFHGDFKLVRLSRDFQQEDVHHTGEVMVYEAKTRLWRTVINTEVPCFAMSRPHSVFVNGVVYWLATTTGSARSPKYIMGFDLLNEVFNVVVQVPQDVPDNFVTLSTSPDGKSLALFKSASFELLSHQFMENWSVWYFAKDSGWEKKYHLVLQEHHFHFHPQCILNDDANGLVLALGGGGRKLVIKGVREGSNCSSDFTLLGDKCPSSINTDTVYTPSLALFEIEDAQRVVYARNWKCMEEPIPAPKKRSKCGEILDVLIPSPKRRRMKIYKKNK